MRSTRHGRRLFAGLAMASVLVFAAACGGGSGGSPASTNSEEAAANAAAAQERVSAATAEVTSGVPTEGPKAVPGKFVVLIPCAEASEGCAQPARGAKEAAELLGWRVETIDGGGTADAQAAAVRRAVTLGANGIITFAIDPDTIQGAVQEARAAGVAFVAQSTNSTDLVDFSDNPTAEGWEASGAYLADYAIAQTGGEVRALVLHDTGFETMIERNRAFVSQLEKCSTCQILDTREFTFADLATSVPQTVQQMAQTNPDFNVIYIDYDYAVDSVLQGLRAVGRDDVIVLGSDGTSSAIECIRQNCGQDATTAFALDWAGWSNIDIINRIFAGADPAGGAGALKVKLVDQQVAQGIDGLWDGDLDFRSAYKSLWGV
ncbi:substrate-binding domain-containing protein [Pseudonocardia sp. H11422]|uniref:substrate-binding domain-containing protein n=1 Tax=Pseudonocardia sp. H11422 TaxID=2835866 RepID=UPI001BDCCE92|nr:substrate-binding domain-containing protein [Pseudonocardia sp. H11422]